jgi:hypothetical protein
MSDLPPASHKYLSSNAVSSQIVTDVKEISKTQVVPSVIMAGGGFFYALASGQLTSVGRDLSLSVCRYWPEYSLFSTCHYPSADYRDRMASQANLQPQLKAQRHR